MKYVILIQHNPTMRDRFMSLPIEERRAGLAAYTSLHEDLTESGELIASEALADPALGTRIPAQAGHEQEASLTDGPYAEVKEHLAGFYLVDCDSPERAFDIGSRIPEAALGMVEVRPVLDLSAFEM